jgi:hypothetical protein
MNLTVKKNSSGENHPVLQQPVRIFQTYPPKSPWKNHAFAATDEAETPINWDFPFGFWPTTGVGPFL